MRLPDRLKRSKLGVRTSVQKVWPRHRRWVRAHGCCVPGCLARHVDFAHLRSAANAGTGLRPHDIFGVSLCRKHHDEQHRIGADAFGDKYGIDLWALAAEFGRDGIRVNAVAPGLIATPLTRERLNENEWFRKTMIETCPLGRGGDPAEVAVFRPDRAVGVLPD